LQGPTEVPGGDWVFTGIDRQGAMFAVHSKKRATPTATTKDTKSTKSTKNGKTTKKDKRSGRARLQTRRPTKKKTAKKRR
jgi:hypothetical protein